MNRIQIIDGKIRIPQRWGQFGLIGVAVVLALAWPRESRSRPTPPVQPLLLAAEDVQMVKQERLADDIEITGTLNPVRQAVLNARTGGEVLAVGARAGDAVQAGQLVVSLDTRDLRLRVQQAEASLAAARAQMALAQQQRDRAQPLRDSHYVSDSELSNAERQVDIRAADVSAAEASLAQARQQLADAAVRAPFAARVSERLVEPGQSVPPGSPLLRLVDLSVLELEAQVPATALAALKTGQVVSFSVDGYGDRQFAGRISRINPVAQAASRRIPVYVQVDNRDGLLRAGLFAKGTIRDDSAHSGLSVPATALQPDGQGGWRVHTLQDGHLQARPVTVALRDESRDVALVSGLRAGDRVLVQPPQPGNEGKPFRLTGAH